MIQVESRQLETVEGSLPCDVYAHRRSGSDAPTVAFIHGMSLLGHRDPRQVKVCEALAAAGFRVYAPHFEEVANLRIQKITVQRIKAAVLEIVEQSSQRISIFSVSFSAGLSLLATAELRGQNKLKGLCSIGGFSDVASCLHYLIDDPEADEYGKLIIYRNYLTEFEALYPGLMKLLDAAARDNALPHEAPSLPGVIDETPSATIEYFERLMTCNSTKTNAMAHIYRMHGKELEEFNIERVSHKISCPVTFIHGETDNVIPAQQSKALHQMLLLQGHDTELVVSPLLSHGDRQPLSILSALQLGRGFDHFMRHAMKSDSKEIAA